MRTPAYLSSCSALLICALAARGAVLRPHAAEELTLDNQGLMHWADDAVAAAADALPALGRPDFSALDVQALEAQAKPAADWLRTKLHEAEGTMASVEEQAKQWLHAGEQQASKWLHKGENEALAWLGKGEEEAKAWLSKGLVAVEGMQYERLVHPHFPQYSLRLAQDPLTHCDPDVKSYAGYLDVEDKHFWFSFFESRSKPSKDPVLLWLNGGPGCSSSTGSLFEGVGACVLAKNGTDTAYNKLSWSNHANLLVLDQPVNVGFSYSDSGNVNNTPLAAEDAYAFLQLFFAKFDKFASNDFHIAAESYGGRYAPLFAAKIHEKNQALQSSRFVNTNNMAPKHIQLASVMLGNGLTEPQTQFASVPDYACKGKYAIFEEDSPTCTKLYSKASTCASLIGSCYSSNSRFTCLPAALYCWSGLYTDAQQSGLNLYDVRRKCDRAEDKDGPLCYRGLQDMERYMNMPSTKKAYGVPASLEFKSCNMEINQGFMMQGDSTHNSAEVLPQLIADGVRVLVYAGEADFMCNAIGNERWLMKLEQPYHAELEKTKPTKWIAGDKSEAGYVRAAGKGFGNVAYVRVANAGHMVPLDVPGPALEMVEAWLSNKALV